MTLIKIKKMSKWQEQVLASIQSADTVCPVM